jgi:hypothetical protein
MLPILPLLPHLQGEDDRSEEDVPGWVEALSSDDLAVRERAHVRLLEFEEPALSKLMKGARSGDPEKRARCIELIKGIEFEPGAREKVDSDTVDLKLVRDPGVRKESEDLVISGKSKEILLASSPRLVNSRSAASGRRSTAFGPGGGGPGRARSSWTLGRRRTRRLQSGLESSLEMGEDRGRPTRCSMRE